MVALAMFGCWAPSAHAADRPNVIVIQTDDQNASAVTHRVMPETVDLLRHHGTTFSDYIDSGPLCCPSRALRLAGQYGHTTAAVTATPNPPRTRLGEDNPRS